MKSIYCSKYSYWSFTPFYGFVKWEKSSDIIGIIYKYASNNSLYSYLSSKEADDIFINNNDSSNIFRDWISSIKIIIHRDLKPSNILLDHDFIPCISDFEMLRSNNNESKSTSKKNDLGSLQYTSVKINSLYKKCVKFEHISYEMLKKGIILYMKQ